MALKALVCPQCGANLSLDDSRDFGFCQFCGTKVMLHETIEVKHSGSIKIDTSDQENNFLQLANNAFSASNFNEALSYYNRVLELNPKNIVAIYLKGICAVYTSPAISLKSGDYLLAATNAKRIAADNPQYVKVYSNLEQYSVGMVNYILKNAEPVQPISKDQAECLNEYAKAVPAVQMALNAVNSVNSEVVKADICKSSVSFIDTALSSRLTYIAGTVVDKKGRSVPVFKNIYFDNNQLATLNKIREQLKNAFNNLPSKTATANDLNSKMMDVDEKIAQLRSDLNQKNKTRATDFLKSIKDRKNPEIKARLASLDSEIHELNQRLSELKSKKSEITNALKEFNSTLL